MLTCCEPEAVVEAVLVAVIVTVLGFGIAAGGVYTPLVEIVPYVLLPPAIEFTLHVTPVLVVLTTLAVKVEEVPSLTWLPPLTVTLIGSGVLDPPPPPEPQPETAIRTKQAQSETAQEEIDRGPIIAGTSAKMAGQGKAEQRHRDTNQVISRMSRATEK